MNTIKKNKLLTAIVVLLLLMNSAVLVYYWVNRPFPRMMRGNEMRSFLENELKFDENQKVHFHELVDEHRSRVHPLRLRIRETKDSMFSILKDSEITDSAKSSAVKQVSLYTEQLDLLTLVHFQKIRALCNPDQKIKFDALLHKLTEVFSAGNGPGRNLPEPENK